MTIGQLELPLFAAPANVATCQNCGKAITHKTDRANPYWEHPNKYPYCKGADGQIGKANPAKRVLVEPLNCQTFSVGQCCRYFDGHSGDHSFGGGMNDPIHLRHCAQLEQHAAHMWPDGSYACSGRPL